jgi:hypothetical protein
VRRYVTPGYSWMSSTRWMMTVLGEPRKAMTSPTRTSSTLTGWMKTMSPTLRIGVMLSEVMTPRGVDTLAVVLETKETTPMKTTK